jgi:hypothetical protein
MLSEEDALPGSEGSDHGLWWGEEEMRIGDEGLIQGARTSA